MAGVYGILNNLNQKWYVGSSLTPRHRLTQHFSLLRRKRHHNCHLQRAFNMYGENSFTSYILQECPAALRVEQEKRWAAQLMAFRCGYNIRTPDLVTVAEETKLKISRSLIGVNTWTKGVKRQREVIERIHRNRKLNGKPISLESRLRYRASKLGKNNPAFRITENTVIKAKELRARGVTYRQIGSILKMSWSHASNICNGLRRHKTLSSRIP